MSDLSLLATQLAHTTRCAEDLDRALLCLKRDRITDNGTQDLAKARDTIKRILASLLKTLKGELVSQGCQLREETIEILRGSHRQDWQAFVETLRSIHQQLGESKVELTQDQLRCLEDIGNALDTECSILFQRMQGRHR